jgi:hypothetical protein
MTVSTPHATHDFTCLLPPHTGSGATSGGLERKVETAALLHSFKL